jgi:soluble lytic murein transglycosylase
LIGRSCALAVALACAGLWATIHYAAAGTPKAQDAITTEPVIAAKTPVKLDKKRAKSKDKKGKKKSTIAHEGTSSDAGEGNTTEEGAAPVPEPSDPNVALVKRAIETLHHGGTEKATEVEAAMTDPAARKLVEWIILRSHNSTAQSTRYVTFIARNPGWPSLGMLRRFAEEKLWAERPPPTRVRSFFEDASPQTPKGRLSLARALLADGETEAGGALIRQAWRNDPLSADLEEQALKSYSDLLNRADHKARMEKRLFARDHESALRAARRLGTLNVAIARLRIAINGKGGNTRKLLEAVPAEAHEDPGYVFARLHMLRHQNKVTEAAEAMLSAPTDIAEIHDAEEWWVERRVLARRLLDIGDSRSAYLVVRDAAEPVKENSRVERQFMAGWIALRFLNDPGTAAMHFARIAEVSRHPTSLARCHYWLGRVAEAQGRRNDARAEYEAAAYSSAAYYGQLARARLGLGALALRGPPAKPEQEEAKERQELIRALDILYALDERALALVFMADLGDKLDDVSVLSALGELAEQHQDARGMLHLGKAALARGLPLEYYAFPTVGVPRYSAIGPGIDSALLFAIIRQESSFNPADMSAAHAMGLMQVTPVAGRDTCKRFGCKFDVKRLKNDSPYNLQLGAAELGAVIEEYDGNYAMAFAAYNAGRGRVQEWIKAFGDPRDPKIDPVDWVERIPIMETRNYVQRVMENMQVYRMRFGGSAALTIEKDLRGNRATGSSDRAARAP